MRNTNPYEPGQAALDQSANGAESEHAQSSGQTRPPKERNWLESTFIWLSGAGADSLALCPKWEQRKYVAFGAAVLVPTVFALVAASYAVSTLTSSLWVIIPVALMWAFIILTIDRALLATYRVYQPKSKKITQFTLRLCVAVLMGLTISHPLTLLLFKDTITAQIETERDAEIAAVRKSFQTNKTEVETRIQSVEASIAKNRAEYKDSFEAKFIAEDPNAAVEPATTQLDTGAKVQMRAEVAEAIAPHEARIGEIGHPNGRPFGKVSQSPGRTRPLAARI